MSVEAIDGTKSTTNLPSPILTETYTTADLNNVAARKPYALTVKHRNTTNSGTINMSNHPQLDPNPLAARQEETPAMFNLCSFNNLNFALSTTSEKKNKHVDNVPDYISAHNSTESTKKCCNTDTNKLLNSHLTATADEQSKKSQNMTECVPVPSSEHVAEIVGRQGCKIKALRAKTNTYIKTPVRGEEPIFVVTGRKEDVSKARSEILSAAEHFSLIRVARRPLTGSCFSDVRNGSIDGGSNAFDKMSSSAPKMPGQVTIQVRVPYRVVGLVVGPKGTTIKNIQHQTKTYIVTPSREKEPIFEVTGLPDNVQSARKQIEAHICLRTGSLPIAGAISKSEFVLPDSSNDVLMVHSLNVLSQILDNRDSDVLYSIYEGENMKNGKTAGIQPKNNGNKKDLNISCPDKKFAEKRYINLFHADNFHLRNIKILNKNSDYMKDLIDNSNFPREVGDSLSPIHSHTKNLQIYPSPQPTISSNQPMQCTSRGISSYMQINFTNNKSLNMKTLDDTGLGDIFGNPLLLPMKKRNVGAKNTNKPHNLVIARSSSASSTASSKSANNSGSCGSSHPELLNIWKNYGEFSDIDEGIGDTTNIWTLPTSLTRFTRAHCSPSISISPADSLSGETSQNTKLNSSISELHFDSNVRNNIAHSTNGSCNGEKTKSPRIECLVCNSREIDAALIPCGHSMFCMECANRICELDYGVCPICSLNVYHAMRIMV